MELMTLWLTRVLFIKNYCNTGERDVGTNETPSGITTPTAFGYAERQNNRDRVP